MSSTANTFPECLSKIDQQRNYIQTSIRYTNGTKKLLDFEIAKDKQEY